MNWITCNVHLGQLMFGILMSVSHGAIGVLSIAESGLPGSHSAETGRRR
jgi:hypothetical protein